MATGMRMLGQADVLRTAAMLPGVSTSSDYGAGLSVNGSDYSQNVFTLDGARVWFPYRFGGIFSDFNTSHISSLHIPVGADAGAPVCVGANVQVATSDAQAEGTVGVVDVGILSSSVSISTPIEGGTTLRASGRVSYINEICDQLIKEDPRTVRYGFEDLNLTVDHRINDRNAVKISGILSGDRLRFNDGAYALDTRLRWRNAAASITYHHRGDDMDAELRVSGSGLWSRLSLSMPQFEILMPSSVSQLVADGRLTNGKWEIGYRGELTFLHPLHAHSTGKGPVSNYVYHRAIMLDADLCRYIQIGDKSTLRAMLRSIWYNSGGYHRPAFAPSITYLRDFDNGLFTATLAADAQYLHQVGFSDIGLASDFWVASSKALAPQRAYGIEVGYRRDFNRRLSLYTKIYTRRILHAPEYFGDVLGVMAYDYDPYREIEAANGYNIGGNFTVNYHTVRFSGWAGYSLAVCRRHWESDDTWSWAASSPLHSLKLFGLWRLTSHIDINAYFTLSSGRPYTPINAIFMVGGNVLTEYGAHNSARLPINHRLDLSATYRLPMIGVASRKIESFVNISLINAYGHRNVEMQYFTYNDTDKTIYLHKVSSLYRFLPSVSYSVKF